MNLFRKTIRQPDPAVSRSPLTITEALEAARQAGRQTPDTGLFERWLRAKGLSTRGNVLIARMRQEYEQAFEERFTGQIAFLQKVADTTSPRLSGPAHLGGGKAEYRNGNCPIIIPAADGAKLNRLFLEGTKGGDASRRPVQGTRNEGGSNPPSPKGGDANCKHALGAELGTATSLVAPPSILRTSNAGEGTVQIPVPSPDSIESLYASGKASSLKEALAILGGGR